MGELIFIATFGSFLLWLAWTVLATIVTVLARIHFNHNLLIDPTTQDKYLHDSYVKLWLNTKLYVWKGKDYYDVRGYNEADMEMQALVRKTPKPTTVVRILHARVGMGFSIINPLWLRLEWIPEKQLWEVRGKETSRHNDHVMSLEQQLRSKGLVNE